MEKDDKEKTGKLAVVCPSVQLGDSVSITLLPGVEIGEQSLIPAGVVERTDIPAHKLAPRDSREDVQENARRWHIKTPDPGTHNGEIVMTGLAGISGTGVAVRSFEERNAETWDDLVARSWNGTFLHERRFISYHGERFKDVSLIIEDERGRILGVFPAALDPTREARVISHPGLTYGGIVHAGHLRGTIMLDTLQAIVRAYQAMGLRFLRYKVVPHIYHKVISNDDLYALFRLGATRYRCDLSATIDLESPGRPSQLRRRDLNKARKASIQVTHGPSYLESYWATLEENLADKHGAHPAHTLEEITDLQRRFPEQIECIVGTLENDVVAGVVMFNTSRVAHVQYSASSASGNSVGAQTAVMYQAIERSKLRSLRYFDFGISNEREGWMLNEGLYKFKTSFGASGIAHEFYELDLHAGCAA